MFEKQIELLVDNVTLKTHDELDIFVRKLYESLSNNAAILEKINSEVLDGCQGAPLGWSSRLKLGNPFTYTLYYGESDYNDSSVTFCKNELLLLLRNVLSHLRHVFAMAKALSQEDLVNYFNVMYPGYLAEVQYAFRTIDPRMFDPLLDDEVESIGEKKVSNCAKQKMCALGDQFPEGERYFGLQNLGNTCYCNSILQAFYFCVPFREQLLEYYGSNKNIVDAEENLLTCLADLFIEMSSKEEKRGVISPKLFVEKFMEQNEGFEGMQQQDAHEFLNILLSKLVNILEKEPQAAKSDPESSSPPKNGQASVQKESLVCKKFQAIHTSETRCLGCKTVTTLDEIFFDLSLDIEQNSSIASCLEKYSSAVTLVGENKYFCVKCSSYQEAEKSMKIKKPPQILVIHLKRFTYTGREQLGQVEKLSYRVVFPLKLTLSNTVEDADDFEYSLFAVVVHVGSGPNQGHYTCLIKSHNQWLLFDDEKVKMMNESDLETFFGSAEED